MIDCTDTARQPIPKAKMRPSHRKGMIASMLLFSSLRSLNEFTRKDAFHFLIQNRKWHGTRCDHFPMYTLNKEFTISRRYPEFPIVPNHYLKRSIIEQRTWLPLTIMKKVCYIQGRYTLRHDSFQNYMEKADLHPYHKSNICK